MSKKAKTSFLRGIILKSLLVAAAGGGYYVWQNPELIEQMTASSKTNEKVTVATPAVKGASTKSPATMVSDFVGKTTKLVEEGLGNIKVPKQLSGQDEEINIEEVVNEFTAKIKGLPQEQVDRVKVQFCQDLLENVPNASVMVTTE